MKSAFVKEVLRSIRGSLSRFMALVLIVALGAGFYAGLRMTAPDMQGAADTFFDGTQLYDIRILSSLGLTDDDVEALEALDGVEAVMPAHEVDMVTLIGGSQYTVRIHSLDIGAARASDTEDGIHALSDNPSYLNRPILVEGRWPERAGECVVSADRVTDDPVQIGEVVQPVEGTRDPSEVFESDSFTVVGTVSASYYPSSSSLGMTSLGSGYIQQYLYVPQEDFASESVYTELFVRANGAQELPALSSEYRDTVQVTQDRLRDISSEREDARYKEVLQEAEDEYEKSYAEYQEERQRVEDELEDARLQLEEAAETIASSEQEIEQGRIDYENGIATLATQKSEAEETLARNYRTLVETAARLDEGEAALKEKEPELTTGWKTWQEGADELALGYEQLKQLDPNSPEYAGLEATLAQQQTALDAAKVELDEKQSVFDTKTQEIATGRAQLSAGWTAYHQGQSEAESRFASAQEELNAAEARLAEARIALEDGKAEYEKNVTEYEEGKAEAEEEFAQAEQEFADAREEIESIEKPTWYILDRTKNTGIESFRSDSIRIDQIAQVFPFLFFLVAALVALTTMTRMVDEERMLIGTYKALGYSRAKITSKYIFYALSASVIGSVVGIVTLSQVLPGVIINAYGIMYTVPQGSMPIDGGIAALSAGFGIGVTLIATAGAAVATLREKPALLMLPRAPKPGKRIVLERIKPLWKRVSFSWKVTFRNIFRYKRRFFMTIIGIAGCTALLLTGLGLSNAINDIIPKQFNEIYHYNAVIGLDKDISEERHKEVESEIKNLDGVTSTTNAYESIFASIDAAGKQRIVYAIVPQEPETFSDYISIRTRETQEPLSLSTHEIIISEKLATELEKKPGDTITFSEVDEIGNATSVTYDFVIGGICENYVGAYVYLSPEYYESVTGEEPSFTTILAKVSEDQAVRKNISDAALALEEVETVGYNDESIESYQTMMKSVDAIVVVLVVAAAALAFVVLYNLTNINITERQREIATLKVLGFVPREVDAYIFRETFMLTILGALVGLVLGVWMENFVVVTAEVDAVMFGRAIHISSFVLAFLITLAFSGIVALAMRKKLVKINMVESLKSVE